MRVFGSVRISLALVALAVVGFAIAWPLGVAALAWMVFAERFGLAPRLAAFGHGLRHGLMHGSCNCGPSLFFDRDGRCTLDHRNRDAADHIRPRG